ncbi:hypothetical protein RZN22_05605 [Bacillaceae bacterium S4-13-58]
MSSVKELHRVTCKLRELITNATSKNEREKVISDISSLIEQRGPLLEGLPSSFEGEDRELMEQIILWDKETKPKLEEIFSEIKGDIRNLQRSKQSNKKYTNPYNQVSVSDGMFLDKKK